MQQLTFSQNRQWINYYYFLSIQNRWKQKLKNVWFLIYSESRQIYRPQCNTTVTSQPLNYPQAIKSFGRSS